MFAEKNEFISVPDVTDTIERGNKAITINDAICYCRYVRRNKIKDVMVLLVMVKI